ncbi:MAG TPA: hypothetical protein VNL14_16675 [Candidatus Acidoferrales bacterium]|nr:hypothetical protein [Candidatus Acidoferrales bacterium]
MSVNGSGGFLSRDAFLKAGKALKQEIVEIPELGGKVIVRELTGHERDLYETLIVESKQRNDPSILEARARIAFMCCIDEHGNQLFEEADFEALRNVSAAALDRIWDVAMDLSGMRPRDKKKSDGPPSANAAAQVLSPPGAGTGNDGQ